MNRPRCCRHIAVTVHKLDSQTVPTIGLFSGFDRLGVNLPQQLYIGWSLIGCRLPAMQVVLRDAKNVTELQYYIFSDCI